MISILRRWQIIRKVDHLCTPRVQLVALKCPVVVPAAGCEHHPDCSRQRPTACGEPISRWRYVLVGDCGKH